MTKQAPVVLVLASGRGERFVASGGTTHKLKAALAGSTVLQRTLDMVRASGLPWHLEETPHPGMGDSIAAAVRHAPSASGWLILPGDMPLVSPATLLAVAAALEHHTAVVPHFQGKPGHPVGFAMEASSALGDLTGDKGASSIVKRLRAEGLVRDMEVEDVGICFDIDTVDDLRQAQSLLERA